MSEPAPESLRAPRDLREAAITAARRGELTAALGFLRHAAPRDLESVLLLGDLLRRAGELEEARAVLEMGKNLAPSNPALRAKRWC